MPTTRYPVMIRATVARMTEIMLTSLLVFLCIKQVG